MSFEQWQPIYREIVQDMGFDEREDERAARLLSELILEHENVVRLEVLRRLIEGGVVLVCGNAPTLARDLGRVKSEDYDVLIAADGATEVLLKADVLPSIIVTDLDAENIEAEVDASREGAVVLVHAHGDNIPVVRGVVPRLDNLIGTTQAKPLPNVHNFGGFTDGDRAVFLADYFDAKDIELIGFDFKDPNVSDLKKKKLVWAERLIEMVFNERSRHKL
ncbi:hypothetical protein B6V01_001420 [Methanosarcinales archaeon ex4572_44]|nr:MAG: hypothetical protein B6U67_02545 [Methanosarcinales archaeon ex4484_138]PHP45980.1 MAG: hypothetical protein B6V01_001420 [Methanosarcinales archaeon ex4572_44]RLG26326.1 MAG: hypothetical protein DRN85_03390 [Methanosarcinales archaeon]RLG28366.1 MAG: hypothetical protein DRN70_00640 [Methanosarcinales archaeon]